jgi:glycine cleavage system H protein
MAHVKYTKDHEYVRVEDGVGIVGITDHAQHKLGDVTFVDMPAKGTMLKQSDTVGVVESVKAASDIYSPVSGEVIEINEALRNTPELINQDPEGGAWLFKVVLADPKELDVLMDRESYINYAAEQA